VRFSYAESMTDPSFYAPLARAAEEAGYHAMVIPDSICYPRHATSTYPYNPDGSREFLEDKPFLEPFSLIPALGAVTSRLRFTTFVVKAPLRNPVLLAKQATSTAVLTGGRLALGVGTSPWREDYDVLGVDWAGRGRRLEESVAILRGLAGGGYFEFHGKYFALPAVKIAPVPAEPIPVLIGGHSDAALRRAARLGDGWMHGGGDPADLPGLLARLAGFRRQAAEEGEAGNAGRQPAPLTADPAPRAPSPAQPGAGEAGQGLPRDAGGHRGERSPGGEFQIHVISMDAYTVDGVRRLEDQGVTDVIVGFRWPYAAGPDTEPLGRKLDHLRRFAGDVIAKLPATGNPS
jgi:probable F420-dependent oxidoreductase